MKIAIYARYSTDQQRPTSIDDQVRMCREVVERLGLSSEPIREFSDKALTGTAKHNLKREALQELLAAWDLGEFDLLVTDELSRLTRDGELHADIQRRLETTGVRYISADGLDTNHANWQLMYGLNGIVNQHFIRETRHRVSRTMRGQLERGYMIATPAYGYQLVRELDERGDRKGTHWIVDPVESKIVEEIFELRFKGVPLGGIAKILNSRGLPPPRPKNGVVRYWRPGTVAKLLSNSVYRGVFYWHGSVNYRNKAKKLKRDPGIKEYPRPQLRIVSDELWNACNSKTISRTGYGGGRHALSGVARCGFCSSVLTVSTGGNSPTLYCAQCSQARRVGIDGGLRGYLSVTGLQLVLTSAITSILQPPVITEYRRRLQKRLTEGVDDELLRTKYERDKVERGCVRLAEALRRVDEDDDLLMLQYEAARSEHKKLQEQVRVLEQRIHNVDKAAIRKQLELDPRDLVPAIWTTDLPPERVRAMLTRLFDEIVFESKPERFVAIVRVTVKPGSLVATLTGTAAMDAEVVTLRFKVSTGPKRPTVWNVELIEDQEAVPEKEPMEAHG